MRCVGERAYKPSIDIHKCESVRQGKKRLLVQLPVPVYIKNKNKSHYHLD